MKILAIDDKRDNLTTLSAVVRDALPDTVVLTALDGLTGLEQAATEDPDVIVLDIVMPGMDGFEVCRRLKADARLKDIPVIFLTALKTDAASRLKALNVGAEGFLTKPLEPVDLVAQIRTMAKIKAASRMQENERSRLEARVVERTREIEQSRLSLLNAMEALRAENQARKHREVLHDISLVILQILNEAAGSQACIEQIVKTLQKHVGVDAVGLRMQEGDDFPYLSHHGFSDDFLRTENSLLKRDGEGDVCRDAAGRPNLVCLCGLVLAGKTDPSNPLFTTGGSCWTNNSLPLLDLPSDQDPRLQPRNRCIHDGFASIALIPIRTHERIVGLLHLADRRKDRFTSDTIAALEEITAHIGAALARKQAEEHLRRSETLFQKVFEILPIGLWIADANGTLMQGNPAGVKIWGMEPKVGQHEYGVFTARRLPSMEDIAPEDWALARTVNQGETIVDELLEIDAFDGTKKIILNYTAPILDGNGVVEGAIVVNQDITDRRLLEEELAQAQKLESIGRLAGGVAHDFNNLIMGVMGYTELVRMQLPTDHPAQEDLNVILSGARRTADLTRQLLAFARKQVINPSSIDPNAQISIMLKMLSRMVGEQIHMEWKPAPDLWRVLMDPGQWDQILVNLCVNARDAIDGVGRIVIETENARITDNRELRLSELSPGDYVLLIVSDDGQGMTAEVREHLFEPFFTTKKKGEGTGLGLATVYGIVRQNKGCIRVYSEPGRGSTFRIYLPRCREDRAAAEKPEARDTSVPRGTETLLLVEDDPAVQRTALRFLEGMGYTVLATTSPNEAVQLAAKHAGEIHLLLTDVIMPELNGRDLADKLTRTRPAMRVLYMSGYTDNIIENLGVLDAGVAFLSKPFDRLTLGRKIREVLDTPVQAD